MLCKEKYHCNTVWRGLKEGWWNCRRPCLGWEREITVVFLFSTNTLLIVIRITPPVEGLTSKSPSCRRCKTLKKHDINKKLKTKKKSKPIYHHKKTCPYKHNSVHELTLEVGKSTGESKSSVGLKPGGMAK